jgi:hypothetical protein
MSQQIGSLGYIGFALQTDFDTPNTTPDVYLPFNTFTLEGKHEPTPVEHSVTSRVKDVSSVSGKKQSEGDVEINLDTVNSGYLFKLFMGNELLAAGTPNTHTFYPTVSGNTPKFATIIRNFGDVTQKQYTVAANTMSIAVSDGLTTLGMGLMGKFPVAGASQTPTTTSGTVMNFARYSIQLGADLATADAASPTPAEDFTLEANNNLIMVHSSRSTDGTNSNDVRLIRQGRLELTGTYKIFFDSTTERDRYC